MSPLDELGNTPEEVVKTLIDLGIKGHAGNCMTCPLAEYLKLKGYQDVMVGLEFHHWNGNITAHSPVIKRVLQLIDVDMFSKLVY